MLLALQHHYVQSANNYVNFDNMFAPILMVLPCQLHQYIGGTVPAAPIGEETLEFCKFKIFTDFLNVSSTNILVQYKENQYFSSTTPIQSAGVNGKGNRIIPRWQPISETKERRSPQGELKTKHLPSPRPLLFLITHYL